MKALRLRSVLVASDLEQRSGFVVDAAGRLAAAMRAELHAIHALAMPSPEAITTRTVQEDVAFADRQLERQLMRSARGMLVGSRTVTLREPYAAILDRALEVAADLIVLGPHRGRMLGRLLGTTADRVMRRATAPCLIVNAPLPLPLPLRRVVVGYDFSGAAEAALSAAVAWVAGLGRPGPEGDVPELVVVHVIRPLQLFGEYLADVGEVADVLNDRLAERWARVAGAGAPPPAMRVVIRWSEPVDDVVARFAENADLLVVGSSRKGELRSRLIGGIASSIGRRAACPVLLVPADVDAARSDGIVAGDVGDRWPVEPPAPARVRRLPDDAPMARRPRLEAGAGPRRPPDGGTS
ncbi:MAG TPA: universal stress protein [Longimicrobiales bacterium]|nr:universal stress protein [Longimicrobiales bacterium]